jgi:hypothetical protein
MNADFQIGGECIAFPEIGSCQPGTLALCVVERGAVGIEGQKSPDKLVAGFHLKPSHARAIASAILSAATEAK